MEEAVGVLDELVDRMDARYEKFKKLKIKDLDSYRKLMPDEKMPRIIVAFDEFADAMADKEMKKDLESSLKRLGGKARAAGIHLIIATQTPTKNIVTGLIKANLPCAVALRVAGSVESHIVLDTKGAETLLGKGDLLAKIGGKLKRLQSPFADIHTIQRIMFPKGA